MASDDTKSNNGKNIMIDPSSFDLSEIECHSSIEFSKKTPLRKQNYV